MNGLLQKFSQTSDQQQAWISYTQYSQLTKFTVKQVNCIFPLSF